MKITEPLILWRGSHTAGSGKGCAMNVVSWENGDTTITDYPACSDRMLARIVQGVNDDLAGTDGRLTPEDALVALRLGHATVGTSSHGLSDLDLHRVYVRCAVFAARKVLHLDQTGTALPAIMAAEAWADHPTAAAAAVASAAADAAAASSAAYAAASSAAAAAYAAASSVAADAAADAAAAYAAVAADAVAADAVARRRFRVEIASEVIDLFKHLTGTGHVEPDEGAVSRALRQMAAVR